jgi:hypothetical protein
MLKDIILWKYERASPQWDVLCLLCLAFIFLTPKAWFEKREKLATQTARLIVKAQDFPADKSRFEQQVRELSGNENAEILEWREKKNTNGDVFYEVEIR